MTPLGHLLAIAFATVIAAAIIYRQIRKYEPLLAKGMVVIFAVFGGLLTSVASIKTNSPPARAIGHAITRFCTNAFNALEQQTGYSFTEAHTNEIHNLAMPDNARLAERIARRGAHQDGFWLFDACTNRMAREGLDLENPVWIQTDGTITVRSPSPGIPIEELALYTTYSNITVYAPLQGSYGFLPGSRWPEFTVSRIWMAVTDRSSRVITWEGALRNRDTAQPVSFQAEFHENGDITYRYNPPQTNFTGIGLYRGGAAMSVDPFIRSSVYSLDPQNSATNIFNFPLSTLHLAYIGDLGDGTGDTDDDGLTDWQEIKVYHADPHDADTDGDGLTDGYEVADGTNPLDFDTDRDGLADATDLSPQVSCGNAYGQSDLWVSATFGISNEIIGMGYANYIQSVLSGTNGVFHYTLTVTVEALDSEGRALIRVGDQYVVVNGLGEYGFLLDIGPEYPIGISPHGGATFAASDERAEITAPTKKDSGSVAVRADGIAAAPSWMHYAASGESHHFESAIDGASPSVTGEWHWWSEEPGVQILSPTSRATYIVWNWEAGGYHDTWATANVMVSCRLGHWAATNTVTLHCGTNDTPHLSFGLNVPRAFFATNGADVVVSFHSDIPTNGTISVADTSLAFVLEEGPPWNWTLGNGTRDFCVTNRIRAATPSLMPEDIELSATLTLEDDQPTEVTATTTAVVLEEVVIPSAPESGLVVLAGSSVAMEAKCRPQGADLSEAGTDWFLGRRRRDGSHESWQKVATNESGVVYSCPFPTGGIYRVKADVTLAGEHEETSYKIKARDTLDPPASHYGVGQHDHIGVVTHGWQIILRNTALSHIGETSFAKAARLPAYYGYRSVDRKQWKCNAFVAYCICETGLTLPANTTRFGRTYPPSANDWAMGRGLGDWIHLAAGESIEPGQVIGHPNPGGRGHCGIVDYDGWGIAAGEYFVNRMYFDFLDGTSGFNTREEEDATHE